MKAVTEIAYTENGRILIPDVRIMKIESGWKRVTLRGYGYIDGILDGNGDCIGWAVKSNPII